MQSDLAVAAKPLGFIGEGIGDRAEHHPELGLCPCRADPLSVAVEQHAGSSRGDQRWSAPKSIHQLQGSRCRQRDTGRHRAGRGCAAQLGDLRADGG